MNGTMPDPEKHPNLFGWAAIASKYKNDIVDKWPAHELQMPAESTAATAPKI